MQIGKDLNTVMANENISKDAGHQMLVTGGGAFNKFLIERIKAHAPVQLVVPDAATIKFKEAIIIALMGVLRVRGEMNVLASATGATSDSCGGEVFQGTKQMITV